jgi:hypothetical protein
VTERRPITSCHHRRDQARHHEPRTAGRLGHEHHRGERHAVAGAEEGGDAHHREQRGVVGVEEPAGRLSDEEALEHQGDEQPADAPSRHGGCGGRHPQRGRPGEEQDAVVALGCPAHRVVARPEGEVRTGQEAAQAEEPGQHDAGHHRPPPRPEAPGRALRCGDHHGEEPGEAPGEEAHGGGRREVGEIERRMARHREEGFGADEGDEGDVAGGGRDGGREDHAPREVVVVGTSSANTSPVTGALKIAATPAAAPATSRSLASSVVKNRGSRRWSHEPIEEPA